MELVLAVLESEEKNITISIPPVISEDVIRDVRNVLPGRIDYEIVRNPFPFPVSRYDDVLDILKGIMSSGYALDSPELACLCHANNGDWRDALKMIQGHSYVLVSGLQIPWTKHPTYADFAKYIFENGLTEVDGGQVEGDWAAAWNLLEEEEDWLDVYCPGGSCAIRF